jgi:hypothetical protein
MTHEAVARTVKEKIRERNRKYYAANSEKAKERKRNWRLANRERYRESNREYCRNWRATNREKALEYSKNYRASHRAERREYYRNRRKDPAFRLLANLRSRLCKTIRDRATRKSDSTISLTGCDVPFLMGYLEAQFREGMEWSNYGSVWEVDHIRPCASLDLTDPEQQRACFHYTNLQPLFVPENRRKNQRPTERGHSGWQQHYGLGGSNATVLPQATALQF